MVKLDLQINNLSRFPVNSERLFAAVNNSLNNASSFLRETGRMPSELLEDQIISVSLLFVNKEEMAGFNLKYHDTEGPTDVLSFPYTDPESQVSGEIFVTPPDLGTILGDIVVCYEVAQEIAQKEGKMVDEVIEFYVLHGLEHLLGHHHE